MSSTAASAHDQIPPAALLRRNLVTYFEVGDLESLCFDLGLDYGGLAGDGKSAKAVRIIEYFSRTGRIVDLVDRCAQLRPNVDWSGLHEQAVSTPATFQLIVPDADETTPAGRSILNLPADRALKIGVITGVLAMLTVLCAFSGGLFASRFITVTFSPVPVSQQAAAIAVQELRALRFIPRDLTVELRYDNVKATSLADQLLIFPDSPVSEVHIQFLDGGDVALNTRMKALGNLRVVTGLAVYTFNGRLVVKPESASIDLLGLQGTTFGWVVIPVELLGGFTNWLQLQLDSASANYWFEHVAIGPNAMAVQLHPR